MKWFAISNEDAGTAHVHLTGWLGSFGVTARDFERDLGTAERIDLTIDVAGGDVLCALAIHDLLAARKTEALVTDRCWSAGVFAMMGAKRIQALPTSRFLIHPRNP